MKKEPSAESIHSFITTMFNLTLTVAVGCPIALYLLYKFDIISDMSLGYIFLPGYLLMLIVLLLIRIAWSFADVDEVKDESS